MTVLSVVKVSSIHDAMLDRDPRIAIISSLKQNCNGLTAVIPTNEPVKLLRAPNQPRVTDDQQKGNLKHIKSLMSFYP